MNANELRIGNFLKIGQEHESYNCLGKVIKWELSNFYSLEKGYNNIEWFEPIPLTEEWLLKFGFVAKSLYSNFILNEIEIASSVRFVKTNERNSFYLDGEIPEFMKIRIVNVHQLQNLYFSLTGEELVVLDAFS